MTKPIRTGRIAMAVCASFGTSVALYSASLSAATAEEAARDDIAVDLELMLAVDVSYSMTPNELEIQRRGYADALRDPEILDAVTRGYYGRIAITYVEWSGAAQQRVVAPWTLIDSAEDLDAFAGALTAEFLPVLRRTSISGVLDFAPSAFAENGFIGDRRVVDVSGDGPNNMGRPVTIARDALVEEGFAINGLPLMTDEGDGVFFHLEDLDLYYEACVIGGPLSFSIPVYSWEEFLPAVRQKLILEIAGRRPAAHSVPARWRLGPISDPTRAPAQAQIESLAKPKEDYDCLVGERMWRRFIGGGPED